LVVDRTLIYHSSMVVVGLAVAGNGVGGLVEPDTGDLGSSVAVVGGGLLCLTGLYTLATGNAEAVSARSAWLGVLAAVLATLGVVLTFL